MKTKKILIRRFESRAIKRTTVSTSSKIPFQPDHLGILFDLGVAPLFHLECLSPKDFRIGQRSEYLKLLDICICCCPDLHVGGQSSPLGLYSEYVGEWDCVKIFFPSLMMFKVNVFGAIEIVIPDIGCMTFVFGL